MLTLGFVGAPSHIALFTFGPCSCLYAKEFILHSPIFYLLLFLIPLVHTELQYVTEKNADKLTYMAKTVGKKTEL